MRQDVIIPSLHRRLSQPSHLLGAALLGGMFCLFRILGRFEPPTLLELALPFLLLLAHLALSPIPWQWTGDEAPRAGLGRGVLQSLAFNLLWVGLLACLLHLGGRPWDPRPPLLPMHPHPPPPMPHGGPGWGGGPRPGPDLGFLFLNVAFATAFGWVFAEKEATEARERAMADRLREAQARALQGQLEPHVLYNALSSLSELVYEDPLAAEEVITRLADLYRMLTVHGKGSFVTLEQERRLVEAYLAMEQMRLGDRLRIHWHWPPWADDVALPPFFLQPLVENAIKHGISRCEQGGGLVITASREGRDVSLRVENTGKPLGPGVSRGVGLGNLEARMALWKGVQGTFRLEPMGEWTVATVRWTLEEAP